MVAASWMPLRKPRQALARSKFRQSVGKPIWWWIATAVDGSRYAPGDRRVDHDADLLGPNARLGQRLGARDRRGVGEAHVLRPPAPLDDARQLLQHAGPGVHTPVRLRQPLVDRRRGDHDRCLHRTDREHGRVDRPEACVTAHVVPSCPGMPLLPPQPARRAPSCHDDLCGASLLKSAGLGSS